MQRMAGSSGVVGKAEKAGEADGLMHLGEFVKDSKRLYRDTRKNLTGEWVVLDRDALCCESIQFQHCPVIHRPAVSP